MTELKGAKGGSSSSSSPTRTPDNLRSKDTVEVVLGLSEGPIYGLENGDKSFQVGDTKLQNESGEYNFKSFQLKIFPGKEDAEEIVPVLQGFATNNAVNLTLAKNVSVTRQTQTGQLDFIDFRLAFNQLFTQNDSGSFNTSVTLRLEYKALSSPTWLKAFNQDIVLSGKTTSTYVKEIRLKVSRISEPYELRVTKISDDSTTTYFSDVSWESFQEVTSTPLKHDYTALVHLVAESSDQFSSIPQWSGIYKGLLVKIPSNYDPATRTYTGIWDGTWQVGWTDNPAWCCYDFVTNDRYGMRSYYPELTLDKYDAYEAAQWCDTMVPDGKGGVQPRYTFNAYITEPRAGKELARYIAGVFNAALFDDLNSTVFLKVDKDDPAVAIFTLENIYSEGFEYTYTDMTTRYNDITMTFKNPELNWEEDRRRVFDQDLIDKYGRIPLDLIAVGCINAHEAIRRGQYKLITSNTEVAIVKFTTNRQAQYINPFDVILVSDPDQGYGISGRIKTLTESNTLIGLRTPVYLEPGVDYTITVTLSDGTFHTSKLIGLTVGYNSVLRLEDAVPSNVLAQAVFTIESSNHIGVPRPFRVVKCEESEGNPDMFMIEAININRNKWYDSDNVTDSGVINYSQLPTPLFPPGPESVSFLERYVKKLKQFHIIVSPIFNRGAYKYYKNDHSFEVWSRPAGSLIPFVQRQVYFGDTLIDHPAGLFEFKILGVSFLGGVTNLETAPIYVFDVTNPADPPADVDWVRINDREVYWGYRIPPEDFAGFEVRYQNQVGRTTWEDAQKAHEGVITTNSFYTNLIPRSARVILVKAVDDFGNYSVNSAVILKDIDDLGIENVIETINFNPTFVGTKVNCSVESDELRATDTGSLMYSGNPNANMYDGGLFYTAVYGQMEYYPTFNVAGAGNFTYTLDCDNNGFELNIRKAGETIWQPIPVNFYIEAGDYELQIIIFGGPTRGIIRDFILYVDVPDIEETHEDVSILAVPTRINLLKSYNRIKTVSVIIQGTVGSDAVTYRVNDKNTTLGPQIELLDEFGSRTSGIVDIIIKGY